MPRAPYGVIKGRLRAKVLALFSGGCTWCDRKRPLEVDHLVPVASGGTSKFPNLVPTCRTCNLDHADKPWREWFQGTKRYRKARELEIDTHMAGVKGPSAIVWRTEQWPITKLLETRPSPWNPKTPTQAEIAEVAESVRTFGVADAFTVRDDGLLLGGHQRRAAIDQLLMGAHLDPVTGEPVTWKPPVTVTVIVGSGIDDATAKALVMALANVVVGTDPTKVSSLVQDLAAQIDAANGNTRQRLQQAYDAMGLSSQELARALNPRDESGSARGKGTAKVTLEFTSAEKRDAVKRKIASVAREGESSGDTVVRLLGLRVRK